MKKIKTEIVTKLGSFFSQELEKTDEEILAGKMALQSRRYTGLLYLETPNNGVIVIRPELVKECVIIMHVIGETNE